MYRLISSAIAILYIFSAQSVSAAVIEINNLPVDQTEFSHNPDPQSQNVDLVVVGIYEADHQTANEHITNPANVEIKNGGNKPIVLVLSSYEPVQWNISLESGVILNEIILNGFHSHSYTGVPASIVDDKSGTGNYLTACGFSYPYNGDGCDTDQLFSEIEIYTGLSVSNFAGTYRASDFSITSSSELSTTLQYTAITDVADISGNGLPELAFLRKAPGGNVNVLFRDAISREYIKSMTFLNASYDPVGITTIPDGNGNGFEEVVVIGVHATTGITRTVVKDSHTGERITFFNFNP